MTQDLGIKNSSENFSILGLKSKYAGILYQTIIHGRIFEVFISAIYMLENCIFKNKRILSSVKSRIFLEKFVQFTTSDEGVLIARDDSIYTDNELTVAGEYGHPGARILVRESGREIIYRPYRNEPSVKHIHAIHNLGGRRFLLTTGDQRKALDLFQ